MQTKFLLVFEVILLSDFVQCPNFSILSLSLIARSALNSIAERRPITEPAQFPPVRAETQFRGEQSQNGRRIP
jgi:hypothetical protein